MKRSLVYTLMLGLMLGLAAAVSADDIAVTVYNSDLGVISEKRTLTFEKGVGRLAFQDVPSRIDPASVRFGLTSDAAAVTILEQNYQFDLVNSGKMMAKYIDKEIELVSKDGDVYTGTLLSAGGNAVLREAGGSIKMVSMSEIIFVNFPSLPDGLITRPTLFWLYSSDISGKRETEVSYQTSGMTWSAEYVGVLNEAETELDWSGWSSIDNRSGKTYEDARLKLVAGDIHRAEQPRQEYDRPMIELQSVAPRKAAGFEEKAFFEYHLYTLPRTATVANNEIKQISLFEPATVETEKRLRYRPDNNGAEVEVTLAFTNSEETGLGLPLPAGRVRVFKADDADGSLILLGEDRIDHTPREEEVELVIGTAFDVVGEYKVIDRQRISDKVEDQTFQIELRNRKEDEAVTVEVTKKLYGYWEILKAPVEYEKEDISTITFNLEIPADSTMTVEFTVRFTRR